MEVDPMLQITRGQWKEERREKKKKLNAHVYVISAHLRAHESRELRFQTAESVELFKDQNSNNSEDISINTKNYWK